MNYEASFFYEETETEYSIEVEFSHEHDNNYGADADGNRGTDADFVEIESFKVFDDKKNEVKDENILAAAKKYFDKNHFDDAVDECISAYENPEPEYDDCD